MKMAQRASTSAAGTTIASPETMLLLLETLMMMPTMMPTRIAQAEPSLIRSESAELKSESMRRYITTNRPMSTAAYAYTSSVQISNPVAGATTYDELVSAAIMRSL